MQARQMRGGRWRGGAGRKRTVLVWSGFMMPRRRGSDEITRLYNAAQSRSCEDTGALCRINPHGLTDCVRDFSFARPTSKTRKIQRRCSEKEPCPARLSRLRYE
jgi:hypothetical protein